MGDPQPHPTTVTPLHIVPESILFKAETGQVMDIGMSVDEGEEELKPKAKLRSSYCLLCRCRQNDTSIRFHRHSIYSATYMLTFHLFSLNLCQELILHFK